MKASALKALKNEVKRIIDDADEEIVVAAHILLKYTEINLWDPMPDDLKASINKGLKEIEDGKGIPHEEVMKKYKKLLKKKK